ncbi:cytochrome c3 family protein [Shewanella intestini]|uniref:Cytochrome c3 family protein n=1 Tax=Shewanella intestini TaxID=2017544 RepID=A0ABS5I359_9GAMM|nr:MULTISPECIES: cytochrome c3 family protein [Shewanella]MBR9727775.1 cytochrome c3 family protein [Shewanella intestini]MRG36232.1 hypothetical protein [Shewanella sp. XMDDZSB0408]
MKNNIVKISVVSLILLLCLACIVIFVVPTLSGNNNGIAKCSNLSNFANSFADKTLLVGQHQIAVNGKCEACHADKDNSESLFASCPTKNEVPKVSRDNCLSCHNDPSKVKEVFSVTVDKIKFVDGDKVFKLHDNHTGEKECASCHKGHGKSYVLCAECHNAKWIMDLKKKGWAIE